MNLISRLFGKGEGSAEVICPRCERPLDPGHACKGLSRRFFLGAIAGAAVASPVIENGGLGGVLDRVVPAVSGLNGQVDIDALIARLVHRRKSYIYDTLVLRPGTIVGEPCRHFRFQEPMGHQRQGALL